MKLLLLRANNEEYRLFPNTKRLEVGETVIGNIFEKITSEKPVLQEKKNEIDYLPQNIDNPRQLSYSKKQSAQKAILWLLSKAPHTVDEVAEHFALSPELARSLIKKYVRSGKLTFDADLMRYRTPDN